MSLPDIQDSFGILFKHMVLIVRMFRVPHFRFDSMSPSSALLRMALSSLKALMCAMHVSLIPVVSSTLLISKDGGTRSDFISQVSKRSVGGKFGCGRGASLGKVRVLKSSSRGGACPAHACERIPLEQSSQKPPERFRQPLPALRRPPAHRLARMGRRRFCPRQVRRQTHPPRYRRRLVPLVPRHRPRKLRKR